MKLKIIGAIAAVSVVSVIAIEYNEWFVYPSRRKNVSSLMKDPSSTQFKNEKLGNGGWLCGEINSKNSFGAYAGFKRFVSNADTSVYVDGLGRLDGNSTAPARSAEDGLYLARYSNKEKVFRHSDDEVIKIIFDSRWEEVCK